MARSGSRASRLGALGFTLMALMLTALTAFLLAKMMGSSQYASEPVMPVLVAATTIQAAEPIKEEHLKIVKWPASSVPKGAFKSVDEILGPNARVTVATILEGEPILAPRLASQDRGTGMASMVDKNLRAFPVPIDRWIADARLVYPGAIVDVLTTIKNPHDRQVKTKLVLQFVRVLALNGATDSVGNEVNKKKKKGGASRRAVVTLLVSPEDAEVLALASREGKIDLMLRNTGDDSRVETLGMNPAELLGEIDPEEAEAAAAEVAKGAKAIAASRRSPRRSARRRAAAAKARGPAYGPGERGVRGGTRSGRSGRTKTIDLGAQ